ncbi:branched-chain amino acid transport system II carrier protein [Corynebacterium sp. H78]|uniref:branched-chain amino acid transport system II carrier protein n=1 Tax=Corynebacterium sp. H78 TaxID=3133417 RepID=UPI0030B58872
MTILVIGLMLFAMFFGAGNLIFPPQLGVEAGTNYVPAIAGFLSTGVLLPMLAVIAVAVSGNGIVDIATRAGKVFGLVFSIAVYLSIGALYAIPRTASVAFETGAAGLVGTDSALALFLFTAIFFAVSLWLSIRPSGIVDSIGQWLTPVLLILIVALVIVGTMTLTGTPGAPTEKWADAPYTTGFLEGYLTMDSLAALVFGIVVISSLRRQGITGQSKVVTSAISAGVIAVILLGAVYLGLGQLGQGVEGSYDNGARLLADVATQSFGSAGAWLFAGIVLLACLTTAVGLITATAEFFGELVPKVGYNGWAIIFTLAGLFMANLGLNTIIGIAIPLNVFLYPAAMTLVFITLIQAASKFKFVWSYRVPVAVAMAFAVLDLARTIDFDVAEYVPALAKVPLYEQSLSWVLPTVVAFIVCFFIDRSKGLPAPLPGVRTKSYDLAEEDTLTESDAVASAGSAEAATESAAANTK